MATEHADIFRAIAAPIPQDSIKYLPKGNRSLAHITARTVMNRLDSVVGPECWWDAYDLIEVRSLDTGRGAVWAATVRCKLSVQVGGAVITKEGIGTDMHADFSLAVMGGESTALKRAGVKLGIGRELYGDGVASYDLDETPEAEPAHQAPAPQQHRPPQRQPQAAAPVMVPSAPGNAKQYGPPQSGKALYAWAKEHNAFKSVGDWGALENYPSRIVDWSPEQVGIFWEHNCT